MGTGWQHRLVGKRPIVTYCGQLSNFSLQA